MRYAIWSYIYNNMEAQSEHVRGRVERIEAYFKVVGEEITSNKKLFDDIKLENKQAYESIHRNLDENDLNKYEESVDKSINYNEALFHRVEKDAQYLSDDQDHLRKKLLFLEKKIEDMEAQIGNIAL